MKLVHNHEIELGLREFDIQKNEKHYHLSQKTFLGKTFFPQPQNLHFPFLLEGRFNIVGTM